MDTPQESGLITPGPNGDPVSVPTDQVIDTVPISSKQDAEPIENQDTATVQNQDAMSVQIQDAVPVQNRDTEPVGNPDGESVEMPDAEPVENPDGELVQNPDGELVQNQGAEPVQNPDGEPVQNQDAEPVNNQDSEPVKNQDAEPVKNQDAETVQNQDIETVPDSSYPGAEAKQNQDTKTVPVSSYQDDESKFNQDTEPMRSQDTEPVGIESSITAIASFYQDAEPVPTGSHQQEEGFPENGHKAEDTLQNKDPAPVTEDHDNEKNSVQDKSDDTESLVQEKSNFGQLPLISPGSTGQGFPYAPADWPNQGDVWTWRVGRRVNSAGLHTDRFLNLPKNLQKRGSPNYFASTQAVARYIKSHFPDADIDAFLASFSWKIPALKQPAAKVNSAARLEETPKKQQKEAENNGIVQSDANDGTSRYSQRKRKSVQMLGRAPAQEKPKVTPGNTQKGGKDKSVSTPRAGPPSASGQKSRQSSGRATRQRGAVGDIISRDAETAATDSRPRKKKTRTVDPEEDQAPIPHIYVSPTNGVLTVSHSPVEVNPEEFDSYLDNIDNLLTQAPEEIQAQVPSADVVASPVVDYDFTEPRMKLSTMLEKDFPSLFFSTDATELANLATQIREDPRLTAEEMVKLKLIEEIPSFSDVFRENKRVIDEADKFFNALDLNKAKVSSLKCEYSELKNNLSNLQMEVESHTESIRQIDEEIAQLRARRVELSSMIGNKNKEKLDLIYAQKMVANSIPKVVQEVQVANSKNPNWEMKKENAIRREIEILTKFAPLKGFRF